jgi:hypothetical protein
MSNRILRLAGLLVDNLVRGTPERLLRIAIRSVVAHHDLCWPHLSDLPQELQAMIARQRHQGLPPPPFPIQVPRASADGSLWWEWEETDARKERETPVGEGHIGQREKSLHWRTRECIYKLIEPHYETTTNEKWLRTFTALVDSCLASSPATGYRTSSLPLARGHCFIC